LINVAVGVTSWATPIDAEKTARDSSIIDFIFIFNCINVQRYEKNDK
jgi:hypothetical protein